MRLISSLCSKLRYWDHLVVHDKELHMEKRKTGTKEWSDTSYNIGIGCAHDCRYCYAKEMNLARFKRTKVWTEERLKDALPKVPRKKRVMFPSTHDISEFYLAKSIDAIRQLLEAENQLVIVSKPHLKCVRRICHEFGAARDRIVVRFTIGSLRENVVAFWEPGAPNVNERRACLKHAFDNGFETSVSIEPMLDGIEDAEKTFRVVERHVTDTIWIGRMNKITARVKPADAETLAACDRIREAQSDEQILKLVSHLNCEPKVRWKDSIREVIDRHQEATAP